MKIKITYFGEDWGYWTVEDYEDYKDAFDTDDEFYEYVKEGTFYPDDRGHFDNDFVHGALESITQSDYCLPELYEDDLLSVTVSWL